MLSELIYLYGMRFNLLNVLYRYFTMVCNNKPTLVVSWLRSNSEWRLATGDGMLIALKNKNKFRWETCNIERHIELFQSHQELLDIILYGPVQNVSAKNIAGDISAVTRRFTLCHTYLEYIHRRAH